LILLIVGRELMTRLRTPELVLKLHRLVFGIGVEGRRNTLNGVTIDD
jgi:hypothetical protein